MHFRIGYMSIWYKHETTSIELALERLLGWKGKNGGVVW